MKNFSISIILFAIIVTIITSILFLTRTSEKPYFLEYSQEKASRLATIIEEFYENKAQRSFHLNISNFIGSLSPYTLEAVLMKDVKDPSFYSKLEYTIGLQNIYFYKYNPKQYWDYKIQNKNRISQHLQEWRLGNEQLVLTYQQELFVDTINIGTVFLVFSEANIGSDELMALRRSSGIDFTSFAKFFLLKKNIHFMYLIIVPALTLLILFLLYREIRKRGHLKQFSPELNIAILSIFFGIALIVFFCINPSHSIQYQDERWYAEKLLEKAKQLKNDGNEQLSEDFFKDIEDQHLPDHKEKEFSALQRSFI